MSRREQIKMTPDEVRAYLADGRAANVATVGPKGRPHLVPVFYVPAGDGIATWTYGSSQKVANLRRLPEATVLVETGEAYEELRGVSMECAVEIVEDTAEIVRIGTELLRKMARGRTRPIRWSRPPPSSSSSRRRNGSAWCSRRPRWSAGTTASSAASTEAARRRG
ncbi:hypothetical protein GCM10029964_120100 [Kibdelosporangium lantanae]